MNFVGRAEIIERIQSRIAMGQNEVYVLYMVLIAVVNPMWLRNLYAVIRRYIWRGAWPMNQSMWLI